MVALFGKTGVRSENILLSGMYSLVQLIVARFIHNERFMKNVMTFR